MSSKKVSIADVLGYSSNKGSTTDVFGNSSCVQRCRKDEYNDRVILSISGNKVEKYPYKNNKMEYSDPPPPINKFKNLNLENEKKVLWYSIKTLCHFKKVLRYSIKTFYHLKKVLWYSKSFKF